MGVSCLKVFIKTHAPKAVITTHFNDYDGNIIYIDANQALHRIVRSIMYKRKNTEDDKLHIDAIKTLAESAERYNMIPVFVFDGSPPELKRDVLDKRKKKNEAAKKKLENISNDLSIERLKQTAKIFTVTSIMIRECIEYLTSIGHIGIQSKEEADSQLAALGYTCVTALKSKCIVASEDSDVLLFGSPVVAFNFGKNKDIIEIHLSHVLTELNLEHHQFIDICTLVGTDYNAGIKDALTYKDLTMNKAYEIYKNALIDSHNWNSKASFIEYLGADIKIFDKVDETYFTNNMYNIVLRVLAILYKKGKEKWKIPDDFIDKYIAAKNYYIQTAQIHAPEPINSLVMLLKVIRNNESFIRQLNSDKQFETGNLYLLAQ